MATAVSPAQARCIQTKHAIWAIFALMCLFVVFTREWTLLDSHSGTSPLITGRINATATLLQNGEVLIVGGETSGQGLALVSSHSSRTEPFPRERQLPVVGYQTTMAARSSGGKQFLQALATSW